MSSNDSVILTQDRAGFGARFKKLILQRDKSVKPKSSKAGDENSNGASSKSTFPKGSDDTAAKSLPTGSSPATSKVSPRLAAEVEFRAAMIKLNDAIGDQYQPPEAFALQTVDHINDVEATCLKLETAIDTIISQRINNSKVDKQVWKECVKRWYCALFPYVKPCLTATTVNALYESHADTIA
jgi:hypothetical protein